MQTQQWGFQSKCVSGCVFVVSASGPRAVASDRGAQLLLHNPTMSLSHTQTSTQTHPPTHLTLQGAISHVRRQQLLAQGQLAAQKMRTAAALSDSSDALDCLRTAKPSDLATPEDFENFKSQRQQAPLDSDVEGQKLAQSCMHLHFPRHSDGPFLDERPGEVPRSRLHQHRPGQASPLVRVQQASHPLMYKHRRLTMPREAPCVSDECIDATEFLYESQRCEMRVGSSARAFLRSK